MIIDFRVRAPFAAYKESVLYQKLEIVELDTRGRVDVGSPESAKNFSMPLLLKEAEAAGIDKLVIPLRPSATANNDQLIELLAQYPDKLIGLAGVNVHEPDNAMREIERCVVKGPCAGIVLEPGQDAIPWHVNSPSVYPIYSFCETNNIPIAVTFGGIMTTSLRYYNPLELDDVAGAFPALKLALCHGGWPFVTECCQIALNRGNVWLAPDLYMVRSPGMADYVMAANHLLRRRVIFASAYPILPLKEAKEAYLHCGLIDQAIAPVMGDNAAEFLNLK